MRPPGLSALSAGLLLALALAHSFVGIKALQVESRRAGARLARVEAVAAGGARQGAGAASPFAIGDARSTMRDLVLGAGYPLEEHYVTTADGYVLGVYRIPHGASLSGSSGKVASSSSAGGSSSGQGSPGDSCRPPTLLLHGVLDSSAAWVLNRPEQSLGFILADAGFDVWLGNSRGNTFSRNHTGLDPGRAAFWDFSWDEMAEYDLPAMVDYALAASPCGARQLAFVGHSQGTTQMFAALAGSPTLRAKLSVAVMLAPAVHMRHIHSYPLEVLAAMNADGIFNLLGMFEFMPSRQAAAALFGELCRTTPVACASIITAVAGLNPDNMNVTRLALVAQFAPSGTSVKNIVHWAQAVRKSRERQGPLFQKYDYGDVCETQRGLPRMCNMRVYHQVEPPSYDLAAISSPPLGLFYGGRDRLADPDDVATLLGALPPGAVEHSQLEPDYEHIDFTWGIDARDRIYPAVLQLLERYKPAWSLQQPTAGSS